MTAKKLPLSVLPNWPRLLDEQLAAAYLTMSPSSFRERVAPHVQEVEEIGGMKRWDRLLLDHWVDHRSPRRQGSVGERLREAHNGRDEVARRQ